MPRTKRIVDRSGSGYGYQGDEKLVYGRFTRVYSELDKANTSGIILVGGAGSSKSYSVCQWLFNKMVKEQNKKILITRKTLPSLKQTAVKTFFDYMKSVNCYSEQRHNQTEKTYEWNNNYLLYLSIDEESKIRSTEFNYIWAEEAIELKYEDIMQLTLRLRAPSPALEKNKFVLSYNPTDDTAAVRKFEAFDDNTIIHSTYLDNPFLGEDYVKRMERLRNEDEEYWNIYGLGIYQTPRDRIYHNFDIVPEIPKCEYTIYGVDFGFDVPSAVVRVDYNSDEQELWCQQIVFEKGLTNADLIAKMEANISDKTRYMYADSAEPDRILEIYRAGFNVKPAEKSVTDGIDHVRRKRIHILESSTDLLREIKMYKNKRNKMGDLIDEPVKYDDHLCDALRYCVFSHLKNTSGFIKEGILHEVMVQPSVTSQVVGF